jgi:hypothetical protein
MLYASYPYMEKIQKLLSSPTLKTNFGLKFKNGGEYPADGF